MGRRNAEEEGVECTVFHLYCSILALTAISQDLCICTSMEGIRERVFEHGTHGILVQ